MATNSDWSGKLAPLNNRQDRVGGWILPARSSDPGHFTQFFHVDAQLEADHEVKV